MVSRSIRWRRIVGRCLNDFRETYATHWNVHTHLYEGIEELLDVLQERGIRLAVLSNKPHEFTQRCVETYLGKWSFDPVLGQRERVPRKPHPAGATEIANWFRIEPEQCLYLGDTGIDMQTALAASMVPIGVLWGFRSRNELETSGARRVLRRPLEWLEWLDEKEIGYERKSLPY